MVLGIACSGFAYADTRLVMPNGGGCWMNDTGFVYGCDTPASSESTTEARNDRAASKAAAAKMEEWRKCERKKDWPGQPSNCDHLLP